MLSCSWDHRVTHCGTHSQSSYLLFVTYWCIWQVFRTVHSKLAAMTAVRTGVFLTRNWRHYYTRFKHFKSFTKVKNLKCERSQCHRRNARLYRAVLSLDLKLAMLAVISEVTVSESLFQSAGVAWQKAFLVKLRVAGLHCRMSVTVRPFFWVLFEARYGSCRRWPVLWLRSVVDVCLSRRWW